MISLIIVLVLTEGTIGEPASMVHKRLHVE